MQVVHNLEVPESKALAASVTNVYQPIKWDQHMTSNKTVAFAAPEHMKVSDIKMLNPFMYKKTEWLITVMVQKIDSSWWYNACKKCLKMAKPLRDSFRCSERTCGTIGAPTPRYKLCVNAGDETGDTEFVIFGRIAQRLTRKPVDTLIADNPTGFIPDEVTKLLEKVFVWNVSFTDNTIATGIVSFQVNSIVAQLDGDNALSMTPTGSQSSSLMLSKDASSSMQSTPQKSFTNALPLPPAISEASHASSDTPIKMPPMIPRAPGTPQSYNAAAAAAENENAIHEENMLALASATATTNPTDAPMTHLTLPATKVETSPIHPCLSSLPFKIIYGFLDCAPCRLLLVLALTKMFLTILQPRQGELGIGKGLVRRPKKSAKKLFPDGDTMDDNGDGCADGAASGAEPSASAEDN